jgi:hypothetical protein
MDDLELREQISAYVDEKIDASELEAWVSSEAFDLDGVSTSTARLAFEVMRLAAERAHGDWTDDELRARLGALYRTYWIENAPATVVSGSGSEIIRPHRQSPGVGTPPAVASA